MLFTAANNAMARNVTVPDGAEATASAASLRHRFGSATGTLVNASALETDGIIPPRSRVGAAVDRRQVVTSGS